MKNDSKSAFLSLLAVVVSVVIGGISGVLAGGLAGVGLLYLMIATGPKWNGDAATGLGGLIILTAFLGGITGVYLGAARALR